MKFAKNRIESDQENSVSCEAILIVTLKGLRDSELGRAPTLDPVGATLAECTSHVFFAIACNNLCLLRGGRRPLNTLAKETFMNESIYFLCFVYRGLRLDEMLSVFRVWRIHCGALTLLLDSAGLHDVARPNAPIGDSEG